MEKLEARDEVVLSKLPRKMRVGWEVNMAIVNKIALILIIVGAINWGLVGLFSFDAVAWITGGATSILARIIYTVIALAGVWSITMLFVEDGSTVNHRA